MVGLGLRTVGPPFQLHDRNGSLAGMSVLRPEWLAADNQHEMFPKGCDLRRRHEPGNRASPIDDAVGPLNFLGRSTGGRRRSRASPRIGPLSAPSVPHSARSSVEHRID